MASRKEGLAWLAQQLAWEDRLRELEPRRRSAR